MCVCESVCVCACVRARVCMRVRARVCMRVRAPVITKSIKIKAKKRQKNTHKWEEARSFLGPAAVA